MTTPDLTPARLEELLAAATQGPWRIGYAGIYGHGEQYVAEAVSAPSWGDDAPLIALSPALAARVIELEAEVERLRESLRALAFRAERAEVLNKKALAVLEPFARAGSLFEPRDHGWDMVVYAPAAGDEYKIVGDDLRAARALAAKLKGEG